MKLMPASRAFATIRVDVASSVGPPNIMVPRHIGEIFRPLRPSRRYCICQILLLCAVIPGRCEASNPESRDSGSGPADHPGMTELFRRLHPGNNGKRYVSFFSILNTPL